MVVFHAGPAACAAALIMEHRVASASHGREPAGTMARKMLTHNEIVALLLQEPHSLLVRNAGWRWSTPPRVGGSRATGGEEAWLQNVRGSARSLDGGASEGAFTARQ